jgi:hypothetical protein
LLTALAAYALGGYCAGRMRRPYGPAENPEYEDGMHGLLVWGLATLLSGLVAATTVSFLQRAPGGAAAPPQATSIVPGERLIGFELDRSFRGSERRAGGDLTYDRTEAARILLTTSSHSGMDPSDRAYLAKLIAAGLGSHHAHARDTSIDYDKRLSGMPPLWPSCSLKWAATNWCLDRGVMTTSDRRRRTCRVADQLQPGIVSLQSGAYRP